MLLSSLLFFLLLGVVAVVSIDGYSSSFEAWISKHGKTYASESEKHARFLIFEENRAFVEAHNARNESFQLGLNAFADLTHSEFKAARLGLGLGIQLPSAAEEGRRDGVVRGRIRNLPSSVDWREKGAVTKVKDQGTCGACWSFSATGAIEGINKIVTGSLISLSEQELIDCDKSYNNGCNGGLMDYAYKWTIKNNGIDTEDDYPYQGREGTCNSNKVKHRVVTIDGYTDIPANSEELLLTAVADQPVSVGICGSDRYFQLYSKGIFTGPCSTALDHAVLIVGYGSKNGVDYWIVKNSWGTSWGMSGYMYMLRNSGSSRGVCGINMLPSYPTKTSPNPPSPDPSPTKCSLLTYCPSGSTCCCSWHVFGVCLSWSCCDLENAVCCKDDRYCCPYDYPVCDSSKKQCLKGNGNTTSVAGTRSKVPFIKFDPWNNLVDV